MGQISIVIIAGLIFLISFESGENHVSTNYQQICLITLIMVVGPAIMAYLFGLWATRTIPINPSSRTRKIYLIKKSRVLFEILILVVYAYQIYWLNLPEFVSLLLGRLSGSTTAHLFFSIMPMIIALMLLEISFYEVIQRVAFRHPKRRDYMETHFKLMILPLVPLFVYFLALDFIAYLPEQIHRHTYIPFLIMAVIVLLAYAYSPLLLGLVWSAVPLPNGELRDRITQLAERDKVKYKDVLVWQTKSLAMANAAVAGLLPWTRNIFLTDRLLQYFSDDEIETIVAHEFGHVRYRHILIYLVFSMCYFFVYAIFYTYMATLIEIKPSNLPLLSSLGTIIFFFLYFVLVFRYLSRRLEYQADLYSVTATRRPATFQSALARLAHYNHVPKSIQRLFEIFSTHPSIENRIDFINRLSAGDPRTLRYRGYLLEVKLLFIALPILVCILFVLNRG
ncbi:MAG: M48 family metallopeptidase [Candidatus Poribacteria bacterium]|nr:M48 family metallopeptidase [Candidatus Poribacteria bacterium]